MAARPVAQLLSLVCLLAAGLAPLGGTAQTRPATNVRLIPFPGHQFPISSLAFSPDGKYIASAATDGSVYLWDGSTLAPLALMRSGNAAVQSVAFDPTGKLLASCGRDGRVVVQSVPDGVWVRSIRFAEGVGHHEKMTPLFTPRAAYSQNGRSIIVAADLSDGNGERSDVLMSFEAATGSPEWEMPIERDENYSFSVSADGSVMAISGSSGIRLFSTSNGSLKGTIPTLGNTFMLSFAPDGRQLLGVTNTGDGHSCMWDVRTGEQVLDTSDGDVPLHAISPHAAFSPDGRTVATLGSRGLRLRDAGTGHVLFTPSTAYNTACPSPTGETWAAATSWCIDLLSLRDSLSVSHSAQQPFRYSQAYFTARGSRVYVPNYYTTSVWCFDTGTVAFQPRAIHPGYHHAACTDGTGDLVLTVSDRDASRGTDANDDEGGAWRPATFAAIWRAADGSMVRQLEAKGQCCAALSLDGRSCVLASHDRTVCFSVETGQERWTSSHLPDDQVVFSPRSDVLVHRGCGAHTGDDHIVLTEAASGREIRTLEKVGRGLGTSAFSHDGHTLACGTSELAPGPGSAVIWDIETGRLIHEFGGHREVDVAVAFSADDQHLATASGDTISIWDIQKERRLREFGPEQGVRFRNLSYSDDGRFLLSIDDENLTRIWNPNTGELLLSIAVLPEQNWVLFTPQGYYSASAGADAYAYWGVEDQPNAALRIASLAQYDALYRPDIVRDALRLGSAREAVSAAGGQGAEARYLRLPPVVEVLEPQSGFVTAKSTVDVTVRVSSPSGDPVVKVTALVNGRPSGSDRGLAVGVGPAQWDTVRFNVPLVEGRNVIHIVAETEFAQSRIEQSTLEVTYQPPPAAPRPTSRAFILCIGCDRYAPHASDLASAVGDARAIADALKARMAPVFGEPYIRTLCDEQATRANVLMELGEISRNAHQTDLIVVYFAGHGISEDGYYFIPHGGNPKHLEIECISGTSIQKQLRTPAKVLMLVDTCHAGALLLAGAGGSTRAPVQDLNELLREYRTTAGGIYAIAATTQIEKAADQSPGQEHSPFTAALLEALNGGAGDAEGYLTLNDLDSFVTNRVQELTQGRQHVLSNPPLTGMSKTLPIAKTR